jgi:hypothetical protein
MKRMKLKQGRGKQMKHLTHTGYYAGVPFCGCNRQERTEAGDTFCHVPYSHVKEFFELPGLCPKCVKVWNEPDETD